MDFCIISSENRRTCHWPEGNPFDKKGWEWWGQVAWQGPASRELRGMARSQGWALTWGDLAMQGWRSGLKMVIKVSHSPVSSQQVHSNEANVRRRWGGSICVAGLWSRKYQSGHWHIYNGRTPSMKAAFQGRRGESLCWGFLARPPACISSAHYQPPSPGSMQTKPLQGGRKRLGSCCTIKGMDGTVYSVWTMHDIFKRWHADVLWSRKLSVVKAVRDR